MPTAALATVRTPWGTPDHVEPIAEGITFYGTPSHGGFHLSAERLAKVDPRARAYAAQWSHGFGDAWFEEDCAWAGVAIAFPNLFPPAQVEHAYRVAAQWR